jgi:glycosyltransferase involved in cell wall biosynthesis
MLSVLIPTANSERTLVPVLSALVSGSADGLVREVILADGGSTDETERIADAAGCSFRNLPGGASARLKAAAEIANAEWLLILDPAAILEEGWTREAAKFMESRRGRAAAFRYAIDDYGFASRMREGAAAIALALTGKPRVDQPVLVSKRDFVAGTIGRVAALRSRAIVAR